MTMKKKAISVLSSVFVGALLMGAHSTAALAGKSEVTTPEAADAMAQHYREQGQQYRAMGGVGWKTGLVQRADADATKYAALAERLRAPVATTSVKSSEAEHYAQLAAQYRAMGGVAYKTGLVQWAEAQQAKYEAPAATPTESQPTAATCGATKPTVAFMLACSR